MQHAGGGHVRPIGGIGHVPGAGKWNTLSVPLAVGLLLCDVSGTHVNTLEFRSFIFGNDIEYLEWDTCFYEV